VLTIENQEFSRTAQAKKDIQAALDKAKAEKQNTNIAKFLNNLESRIYAQISQNLATAMFANGGSNSGTLNFEGNTIFWSKDGNSITMQVTDMVGNQTTITIPLGSFQFPVTP
jgi:membrane-bound inhibitor of C-type lysozyme